MRRMLLALLTTVLVLPYSTRAQERPDFSGSWTMDEVRSESPKYPDFVGPVTVVIEQTPEQLTVRFNRGGKMVSDSYTLYQSEKAADQPGVPAFHGFWDGMKLVTLTERNVANQTVRTRQVRSLDDTGKEMSVETTLIVEHGYTLAGTKNYGNGRDVFKRTAP